MGNVGGGWSPGPAGLGVLGVLCALLFAAPQASAAGCPNEAFRTGASAGLPACRAYELVSPPDSNGRLLQAINSGGLPPNSPELLPTELAAPSGNSMVFMAYMSPLPEVRGATGVADVYEATRGAGGWSTSTLLSLSGAQPGEAARPGGVSPDHSYTTGVAITPAGTEGPYLIGRDGSVEPVGLGTPGVEEPYPQTRYLGAGGEHIIFSTGLQLGQSVWCFFAGARCKVRPLAPGAPPTGTGAVYDRSANGPTHVISLRPGNLPFVEGEQAFYKGTSKDASSVAFEVGGTLYVRIHNGVEGEEATLKVAEGAPVFAGLSDQGRYLFYAPGGEKGTIHRFDTVTEADVQVNPTAPGELVNISGDGSHVYFISEEQIGGEGVSGKPNLYVWRSGSGGESTRYVATVAPSDLEQTSPVPGSGLKIPALTRWTSWVANPTGNEQGPGADSSRTTPDGSVLVFESRAKLTEYDNTGPCGPEGSTAPCTEIYRWEEGGPGVECVSCNFGHAAAHNARLEDVRFLLPMTIIHNLSDDGSRILFETGEPLVEGDTDGINDVYEWHAGGGGSVGLISSGRSVEYPLSPIVNEAGVNAAGEPPPNVLLAVTPNAGDVAFLSQDVLVDGAPEGGVAIYDARIDGGFPSSPAPEVCSEEGCKPAANGSGASSSLALSSESPHGDGNVKPRRHHRRCRASRRHKGKWCSKKGRHHSSHKAARASASTLTEQQPSTGSSSPAVASATASSIAEPPQSTSVLPTSAGSGCEPQYGFESVGADLSTAAAGAHPDFTTGIAFNHYVHGGLPGACQTTEEVSVSLPPGLLGNPNAVGRCKTGELLAFNCPLDSQVGIAHVLVVQYGNGFDLPVYNMELPHPDKEVARLGFLVTFIPVYLDIKVRTASDYGVTATVFGPSGLTALLTSKTTLWSDPSDPIHDEERIVAPCQQFCGPRQVPRTGLAFMTNPSACQEGQVGILARSYQLPGQVFEASAPLPSITGCSGLPFAPTFEAEPTSHVAGAPTGLKTKLVLPQHLKADEPATATMREARVTLPEGMQVAAGAANWIGTCSPQEVGFHEEVDTNCPDASKLGTATIKSPALPNPIEGTIYQRSPESGHQLGLWLTSDALGMHIKLPGELEPDKQTGRLTAVFKDLPQVPVEEIDLDIWGGPRAPLQNPDHCGTYATDFSFSPHSQDPAATGQSQMRIDEGCSEGFDPKLQAGVTNPLAGKFSPLVVDLTRGDGQQALRGFELQLPDGELAKLKGVPLCPDADAAAGTCPEGSRIGSLTAATGPGPEPLTVPQPGKPQPQIYLAGPYQGEPFSIVTEVPAQAGPFDLGVLTVRSGLGLDPETNRAVVKADPLPQFFEGVGLTYRNLHAVIDRPRFSLNPTDCSQLQVESDVTSTQGSVAHPSAPFQVGGCRRLKFKPKLTLKLRGGTERGDYPALTAILKARRGDANIARTSVALPHSEFLAQEHIVTICTRKQFAADKCPKGSVYGRAKAWTPLLAKPLEGPVYLRSSSHPLPDLVAALGGELNVNLVGRIDSTRFGGIRTTFEAVPDAPVTRFVLRMRGGSKSLLVHSTDICLRKHRAQVSMRAQNGRLLVSRPVLESGGCGATGKKHQSR